MQIESSQWNVLGYDPGHVLTLAVKHKLSGSMKSPNLFLLPKNGAACPPALGELLRECLRNEFPVSAFDLCLSEPDVAGEPVECFCIAIDSTQPERVRDAIKERLWPVQPSRSSATLADILQGRGEKTAREFRLDDYGIFLPSRTRRFQAIRTHSFAHHPGYYRYRLALARTAGLPEPMAEFLSAVFTDCPNHLFAGTTCRASRLCKSGLGIEIPLTRLDQHDIIALAGRSHSHTALSSRHENLQKYFLEHDPRTVACEVPVWTESREFADYPDIFRTTDALTGHIDVLRLEDDGRLGVWDYKPRAAAERSAHLQVFLYVLMLALRTGLPLTAFHCGYFDEKNAYTFPPAAAKLTQ